MQPTLYDSRLPEIQVLDLSVPPRVIGGSVSQSPVVAISNVGSGDYISNLSNGYPYTPTDISVPDRIEDITTEDIGDVPELPAADPIDTEGAPGGFSAGISKTTAWPSMNISLAQEAFGVSGYSRRGAGSRPTAVGGSVTIPTATAGSFSETFSHGGYVTIPQPPSITLTAYAGDVPSFSEIPPDALLEWTYADYQSDLLAFLKTKLSTILLDPLRLDPDEARSRDKIIWDSVPFFLQARNIEPLQTRYAAESTLYRDNIERLIDIAEAGLADKNSQLYVQIRQLIENQERDLYDSKKAGELTFAKEYGQNRIDRFIALVASYNQQLTDSRILSEIYIEAIQYQKDRLKEYELQIEQLGKLNQVNEAMLADYGAQVKIVNLFIKLFESSMRIDEAIANITLQKAEVDRLNIESVIIRSKITTQQSDAENYYRETELLKLDLIDAEIEYRETLLLKNSAIIDKEIASLEETVSGVEYNTEVNSLNSLAETEKSRAELWSSIANKRLMSQYLRATEEKYSLERKVEEENTRGWSIQDKVASDVVVGNDRVWRTADEAYSTTGVSLINKLKADANARAAMIEKTKIAVQASNTNRLRLTMVNNTGVGPKDKASPAQAPY